MADDNDDESAEDTSDVTLQARSYTGVFRIERRIRKINDFAVPLRGGLVPAQVGTFIGVLLVTVILWFALIAPLVSTIFKQSPPLILAVFFILVPPWLLSRQIGKPMPAGKTIPGWVRSRARAFLDDEWHRGGTPIKERPDRTAKVMHLERSWRPDAEGAEFISDLAEDPDLYARPDTGYSISPADEVATADQQDSESTVDLLQWVERVQREDAEAARKALEKSQDNGPEHGTDYATYGQVHTDDE